MFCNLCISVSPGVCLSKWWYLLNKLLMLICNQTKIYIILWTVLWLVINEHVFVEVLYHNHPEHVSVFKNTFLMYYTMHITSSYWFWSLCSSINFRVESATSELGSRMYLAFITSTVRLLLIISTVLEK